MDQEYEWLRATSRTFALSIEQLPQPVRDGMTLAYLMLRVSDTLEDTDEWGAREKAEALLLWDRVLAGDASAARLGQETAILRADDADTQLTRRADVLMESLHTLPPPVQEIIVRNVRETTRGMAQWQIAGPLVGTEREMDDYMHYVAGIVGYLITELFAYQSARVRARLGELLPLAREYGLALQTVNIIRGLRKDYERGWVFVPRSFYEPLGLTHHQLFDPAYHDAALAVVDRLVVKAERHLQSGLAYIQTFPRRNHRIRLACMWPLLFAARTLAISRDNLHVLRDEAKIGRPAIRRIMRDSALFGWSNQWLRWYYARLMA